MLKFLNIGKARKKWQNFGITSVRKKMASKSKVSQEFWELPSIITMLLLNLRYVLKFENMYENRQNQPTEVKSSWKLQNLFNCLEMLNVVRQVWIQRNRTILEKSLFQIQTAFLQITPPLPLGWVRPVCGLLISAAMPLGSSFGDSEWCRKMQGEQKFGLGSKMASLPPTCPAFRTRLAVIQLSHCSPVLFISAG